MTTVTPSVHSRAARSRSGARALSNHSVPTVTPGAMAWPKRHSAELSHRDRIAHHRARHERAHLSSPQQSLGSSPTALRLLFVQSSSWPCTRKFKAIVARSHIWSVPVLLSIHRSSPKVLLWSFKQYRGAAGPSEPPPKWSMYAMVPPASDASYPCESTRHDG